MVNSNSYLFYSQTLQTIFIGKDRKEIHQMDATTGTHSVINFIMALKL